MANDLCSSNLNGHVPGKISFVKDFLHGGRKGVAVRRETM